RSILSQLGKSSSQVRKLIDTKILPELTFNSDCTGCSACVGICPTGALAAPDVRGTQPMAKNDRCTTCNLCVEFCRQAAITITTP
ncbi:MAG TPA: 4Fe-4S binding protein, partial [Pelovirga sp.]|nr:4Fe-4S binding protein [Pelovirga sp.]